jgi:hypothetical protein
MEKWVAVHTVVRSLRTKPYKRTLVSKNEWILGVSIPCGGFGLGSFVPTGSSGLRLFLVGGPLSTPVCHQCEHLGCLIII